MLDTKWAGRAIFCADTCFAQRYIVGWHAIKTRNMRTCCSNLVTRIVRDSAGRVTFDPFAQDGLTAFGVVEDETVFRSNWNVVTLLDFDV